MSKISPAFFLRTAILLFALATSPPLLFAQATIHPDVLDGMSQSPDRPQEVLLLLADRVDCVALEDRFQREGAGLQERAFVTITSLQAKAAETQPALLNKLREQDGVDAATLEAYWIVNAVYCRADADALRTISQWEGIASIEPNFEPELLDAEAVPTPMPPVPNGKEPGLSAINAPAMWALGYTGYGTKALVIDSRPEFGHPALRTSYWGNYVPREQAFNGLDENPQYCSNHGTHVTGVVLGLDRTTNDTLGVAFNGNWMTGPLAFEECSYLSNITPSTLSTFQWALNPDGNPNTTDDMPDVINCSWRDGTYSCFGVSANLLASVEAAGIATIWSVGNDGPESGSVCCASSMSLSLINSFTVGALNAANDIANFSSRGPSNCNNTGGAITIKPEVSAPGVNIRSCVPEGNYGQLSGTSFSAPYVSGAVMLLKEAFPYLPGSDIKMALYMTAIDLGVTGEDNTYGRGIIDIYAAYQYLLDEGNAPVPPVSAAREVVILQLSIERDIFCFGEMIPVVTFTNSSNQLLTSLDITYGLEEGNLETYTWSGTLAPGETETVSLPAIALAQEGAYELVARLENPNGEEDERTLNNTMRRSFEVADLDYIAGSVSAAFPQPICSGAQVLLSSDQPLADNQQLAWYANFTGGTPLAQGPVFLTPPLTADTEYYLDLITSLRGGKPDLGGGNSNIGDLGAGLLFDAFEPFRLKSVKIFAEDTGVRIIRLSDANGETIQQTTIVISQIGEQRINLNFDVPAQNNLTLKLSAGKSLSYNTSGVQFPYLLPGYLRIKRSTDAPTPIGDFTYYYYFFDWEINLAHECGRTAVPVTVGSGNAPTALIQMESDIIYLSQGGLVDFSGQATGAVSYSWDFGNGTTSTEANPQAQYTEPGIYPVTLVITNAAGCEGADLRYIEVKDDVTSIDDLFGTGTALRLFPNPAGSQLYLEFAQPVEQRGRLRLVDAFGRDMRRPAILDRIGQHQTIDLSQLPAGVYFLILEGENGRRWTERFVKS